MLRRRHAGAPDAGQLQPGSLSDLQLLAHFSSIGYSLHRSSPPRIVLSPVEVAGVYERLMLASSSETELEIVRDLSRTYPSHVYYQQRQGPGQRSLFNVLRAYSVYDRQARRMLLRISQRQGGETAVATGKLPPAADQQPLPRHAHLGVMWENASMP